jgi:hypothetical protein
VSLFIFDDELQMLKIKFSQKQTKFFAASQQRTGQWLKNISLNNQKFTRTDPEFSMSGSLCIL